MAAAKPNSPELDRIMLEETNAEVSRGWATGPFTKEDLDEKFGQGQWISAKRFPIEQSSAGLRKVRLIDDYSKHGQNLAAQATEKLDHGGLDEVAALVRCLGRALAVGFLEEQDTSGHRWCCRVHPEWAASATKVVARTVDLRSAYKQLPVSKHDLPVAVTCMYHLDLGHAVFYSNLALPFGATYSVYSFNACSRGLEVVMCMVGGLLSSSYFDDFPFVEPELTATSATTLAESLFELLGWEFDSRGHKYKAFADKMDVLGTSIAIVRNGFAISNSMRVILSNLLEAGEWSDSQAASLAGRLNYMAGRPLHGVIQLIYARATRP
eukprot:6476569-Amphidinium_carterae.1